MAIINPLTYTIANGDPVDATPVEANFTQIVQDVNANAAPVAGNASQEFLVAPTTNPAGAVPLAQAQSQFAPAGSYATLNGSSSQQFAVANAATASQAVNLGQANSFYAPLAGNAAQTFAVASATNATQAIQLQQTVGGGAPAYSNVTSSRSLSSAFTNSLVRPLVVSVGVAGNVNPGYQVTIAVLISGVMVYQRNIYNDGTAARAMTDSAAFVVPPGATYEVQSANSLLFWFEY